MYLGLIHKNDISYYSWCSSEQVTNLYSEIVVQRFNIVTEMKVGYTQVHILMSY